jgi:hypothetical protein
MAVFRWLLAGGVLMVPNMASAVVWPGAAPCNATLQACINSASSGSTVEIASDATIDETLSVGMPLTLRAASGYAPKLALDRIVNVTANTNGTFAVEGITLQRGFVNVTHNGGNANFLVRRVRVLESIGGAAEISIYSPASTPLTYEIAENETTFVWNTFDGAIRAAIQVVDRGTGAGNGLIHDNRVDSGGTDSAGILVDTLDNTHTARVYANWIRGGKLYGSLYFRQGTLVGSGGGTLNAYIINNVVSPLLASGDAAGIAVDAYFGALNLQAFNNTVSGAYAGVDVYTAAGVAANGRIANNLLAGNILSLALSINGSGMFSNDHNLLFGGSVSGTSPGPGTLTSDPKLRGIPGNPWLNATSPAIDAADSAALDSLLTSAALARVDGAGLRRFKGLSNLADIGALEFGDTTVLHRVNNASPSTSSVVDNGALNNLPSRYVQVTSNWNPDGASGIYDNHPTGIFYTTGISRWIMRHEDLVAFTNDARYNLFSPADGAGQYRHVVTAANVTGDATMLDIAGLNNEPARIVLATRDSLDPNSTIYDDVHPFGAFYFAFGGPGKWFVSHLDATAMGAGGGYHIYWQEPSANAFVHTTSAGNSASNYTVLDHPLLNNHRCARFQVSQGIGGATFNAHQTGIFYFGNRWAIYNQDLAAIPTGTQFHVVVDAQQVFECSDVIFADGFQ